MDAVTKNISCLFDHILGNPILKYGFLLMSFQGLLNNFRTSISSLKFLYSYALQGQHNLLKLYGKEDTWAVVTGGSDGIGLQFCHELAKQGFNICIVARNAQKIESRLKEVASGRNIKTRSVVADLGTLTTIQAN